MPKRENNPIIGLDHVADVVLVMDATGRISGVNAAARRVLGYGPEEAIGTNALDLVHPDDLATASESLVGTAARSGHSKRPSRIRVRHGDGSWRVVEITANNLLEDPDVGAIVVTAREYDDVDQTVGALRENERRLHAAFDSAPIGMALVDVNGRFLRANQALGRLSGRPPVDLVQRPLVELVGPGHRDAIADALRALVDGTVDGYEAEHGCAHTNGSIVPVRLSASAVRDGEGEALYFSVQFVDLSELVAAQERFRTLVQESSDLILVLREDGTIDYASPGIEAMLGYNARGIEGWPLRTLVADEDTAGQIVGDTLHPVEKMGERVPTEVRFRHRDGSRRYGEVVVRDLRDDASVRGIVVNARDVTETRRAERQLRALFDASNDIVAILQSDGSWHASPAGTRLLGHPPGFAPEGGLLSLIHPDDFGAASAAIEEVRAGTRPPTEPIELRVRTAAGDYRWVEALARDRTDDPLINGVVITARDITERRKQEAALRAAERRFGAAFERSPIAVALIGLDGLALDCNAQFCRQLGRTRDEIIGTDTIDLVHPDDREAAVAQAVSRMQTESDELPDPVRMIRSDGAVVWMRSDSQLVLDDQGTPSSVVATMVDITAQREAEEKLQRSEQWYRTIVSHQSDIVTVVGNDGIVRYISPSVGRILGIKPEEFLGRAGTEGIHPDDQERLFTSLTEQLEHATEAHPVEYRQRCWDDSWIWLEAIGQYLPEELGIEGVIVTARDISERKRAEAEQRETDTQFQAAFAASPLGIGFAELSGRIMWVNQALSDIVGISEAELLAMNFQQLSTPDELERERAETRLLLRGEIDAFTSEKRYRHPSGRTVWGLLYVSLIRDTDGRPKYMVGQLEDVTDRKQREIELTHDAEHDLLTGLQNRAGLRATLAEQWAERTPERPMALLFGDLDRFKPVNDIAGHHAGDQVLAQVARRLHGAVRGGDVVARWGGDEFVVVCGGVTDVDEAAAIAERIRVAMAEPFQVAAGEFRVGMSVGVAVDHGHGSADELLADADGAARQAKGLGRSCVAVAHSAGSTST